MERVGVDGRLTVRGHVQPVGRGRHANLRVRAADPRLRDGGGAQGAARAGGRFSVTPLSSMPAWVLCIRALSSAACGPAAVAWRGVG